MLPQLQVQGRQRFVEQEHLGLDRECPGDRHPLLLPARQLVDPPVGVAGQSDQLEHLRDPAPALGRGHAADLDAEADVLSTRHQRKQGEVLEDQRGRPLVRADAAHGLAAQADVAVVGSMNPETMRRMVVLPQPEGPRNEKNSPSSIVRSRLRTAVKSPKRFATPWNWRSSAIVAPTAMR